MRDQSQIDAMRAAVRGDLERARRRRAGTLLQPEPDDTSEPEPQVEREPEPVAAEPQPERMGLFRSLFRRG